MTKNTVSIELDRESMARFAQLLGNHPVASGVHLTMVTSMASAEQSRWALTAATTSTANDDRPQSDEPIA